MSPDHIVLRVIRGELPLSALRTAGVIITAAGVVRAKDPLQTVQPTLADLGAGLLHHRKRKSLSKWALFIIRAGFIDIVPERSSAEWDAILEAIWDASSAAPVDAP